LPFLLLLLLYFWVPESVRFLLLSGQVDRAYESIERVARANKKPMPSGTAEFHFIFLFSLICITFCSTQGKIVAPVDQGGRGRMLDLLSPSLRRTTLLLWVIWIINAFVYYGVVFFVTYVVADAGNNAADVCQGMTRETFIDLLIASSGELVGMAFTLVALNRLGRKKTQALEFLFTALFLLLLLAIDDRTGRTLILLGARAGIAGGFQAAFVYTPEVYPTSLRSTGMGVCGSLSRIGGIASSYSIILAKQSLMGSIIMYSSIAVVGAIACLLLPIETHGRQLRDVTDEKQRLTPVEAESSL
jgi:hypothetical protein